MKLESLKSKEIENLNEIQGGAGGIVEDTCVCTGGCTVYFWPNGTPMPTGGTWVED